MAFASILLGLTSFVFMVAGFFTSMIPIAGALFSFGGPVFALAGIVTGGIAISRSKRQTGEASGAAIAGLVVSIVGFVLSLVVALTCGLCNACVVTSSHNRTPMNPSDPFNSGHVLDLQFDTDQLSDDVKDRSDAIDLLDRLRRSCEIDASGAGAIGMMVPTAVPVLQTSICAQMSDSVAGRFAIDCRGRIADCTIHTPTSEGRDAGVVRGYGLDPRDCTTFHTPNNASRLTTCRDAATGAVQVASATNLSAIQ